MSISSQAVKIQPPSKLKAKTGMSGKTQAECLNESGAKLAAQAQSPAGTLIAAEATALKTSRDALVSKNEALTTVHAEYERAQREVVNAEAEHIDAIETYARRAAIIAKGDITVLQSLGVEAAATQRIPRAQGPADVPANLRVLPGEDSGSTIVKWARPRGAGAFLAQYKLESPAEDAPSSDWLPAEGFATTKVEWWIENLPPAAHLRVRVRSIGAEIGPWSEEVLGRAR
jgi:hypothetical protein